MKQAETVTQVEPKIGEPFHRAHRNNLAALLLFGFFGLFFLYPLFLSIRAGFTLEGKWSLYWFGRVLSDSYLMGQFGNGMLVAGVTTLICLLISLPLALMTTCYRFAGRGVMTALILLPMILPPFVGAISMRRFLGQFGLLNIILDKLGFIDMSASLPPDWLSSGFAGVVIIQALYLFPILYLNLATALANLNPSYIQAARNLGAGSWSTFFRITLPLLRPGLFAGGTIVFIWAFTDIGTPLMVGYDKLPSVTIFRDLARADMSPKTYGMTTLLLVVSAMLYYLSKTLFRPAIPDDAVKASTASEARELKGWRLAGVWLFFGTVISLAILPHVGVILTAFAKTWTDTLLPESYTLRHFAFVIQRPETFHSILNSLRYASISTLADIILGGLGAWLIVRGRIRAASLLDGLMMMPLAVPGIILAAGFVALTARGTALEGIGPLGNPFWIIVIAYTVRRIPFIVRGLVAGLEQIPETLEQAARNLGAGPVRAIRSITLPLIVSNVIAAGVLTFSFAMLEVSDSLVLAQIQDHYPMTKGIYQQAMSANYDAANIAAAMGVYGMLVLATALVIATLLLGRRLGAIFKF